jgi:hypothetical protein
MTPDQWRAALRAEGVRFTEYPGWTTRGRDAATGKTFGPVHAVLNHHTAGRDSLAAVAVNGVPGLPPPLAHAYLPKSGVLVLVADGRANHAGPAARNVFDALVAEQPLPKQSKASGTVDGNDSLYGIEVENLGDGKDTYTRAQYDTWVRFNAAICRHHGWGAGSVAGHLETSVEGKIDPKGPVEGYGTRGKFTFTMAQFRADVAERLRYPASWSPSTTSKPTPSPPAEDTVPTAQQIAEAVLTYRIDDPRTEGTSYKPLKSVLWWAGADAAQANARVKELEGHVAHLTALVERLLAANTQG